MVLFSQRMNSLKQTKPKLSRRSPHYNTEILGRLVCPISIATYIIVVYVYEICKLWGCCGTHLLSLITTVAECAENVSVVTHPRIWRCGGFAWFIFIWFWSLHFSMCKCLFIRQKKFIYVLFKNKGLVCVEIVWWDYIWWVLLVIFIPCGDAAWLSTLCMQNEIFFYKI